MVIRSRKLRSRRYHRTGGLDTIEENMSDHPSNKSDHSSDKTSFTERENDSLKVPLLGLDRRQSNVSEITNPAHNFPTFFLSAGAVSDRSWLLKGLK